MPTPIIKTEHLGYVYSAGAAFRNTAVEDVSIEIGRGEFVGIIGHTGSGKSTLVQQLNGLLRPTTGRVFIDGEDIWAKPKEIRRFRFRVGLVFQYPEHQLFEETAYKDIAFGPGNMGLSADEIDRRVHEAAAAVDLSERHLRQSPFELSGGQKRRVAIAGVLAMRPEVLILDEPTAGLDPRGRDRILDKMREYHRQSGNTVLLVSHSMEDIAKYATKVLVMNQSRVFCYGGVREVFGRSAELAQMGLSVPQVTGICQELGRRGFPVPPDTFTVAEAKEQILRLLGDRHAE